MHTYGSCKKYTQEQAEWLPTYSPSFPRICRNYQNAVENLWKTCGKRRGRRGQTFPGGASCHRLSAAGQRWNTRPPGAPGHMARFIILRKSRWAGEREPTHLRLLCQRHRKTERHAMCTRVATHVPRIVSLTPVNCEATGECCFWTQRRPDHTQAVLKGLDRASGQSPHPEDISSDASCAGPSWSCRRASYSGRQPSPDRRPALWQTDANAALFRCLP